MAGLSREIRVKLQQSCEKTDIINAICLVAEANSALHSQIVEMTRQLDMMVNIIANITSVNSQLKDSIERANGRLKDDTH